MGKYGITDAAKDTSSSTRETARAHHDARDDSGARSGGDKGFFEKAPSWAKDSERGPSFFPKGKK